MPETATTEADTTAARLLHLLPRLHHALKRDRQRREASDPADRPFSARMGQYRLLMLLGERDRVTAHQLASRLEVSAPTVSTMVRALAEQGLVARERDTSDQRVVWLSITPAGRALVEEERRRWQEVFARRYARLDEADRAAIAAAVPALERLAAATPGDGEG